MYKLLARYAAVDRRIGTSAVPSDPKSYLNKQQQLGLIHLREYGWITLCVRGASGKNATTILRNRYNRRLGILNKEGYLRLTQDLKIRESRHEENSDIETMVVSIRQKIAEDPLR